MKYMCVGIIVNQIFNVNNRLSKQIIISYYFGSCFKLLSTAVFEWYLQLRLNQNSD